MALLLTLNTLWLGALTVAILAARRETDLLYNRMALAGAGVTDGPRVGTRIPPLRDPGLPNDVTLLFLSPDCPPCHDVVRRVAALLGDPTRIIVVVKPSDDETLLSSLLTAVPRTASLLSGQRADAVYKAFRVQSEPFAVQCRGGLIVGKGYVRDEADVRVLL